MLTTISTIVIILALLFVAAVDYFDRNDPCLKNTMKALALCIFVVVVIMGVYSGIGWISYLETSKAAVLATG